MSIIRRQISLEMLRIGHLSIVANSPQHGLHLPQDEGRMVDGQTPARVRASHEARLSALARGKAWRQAT